MTTMPTTRWSQCLMGTMAWTNAGFGKLLQNMVWINSCLLMHLEPDGGRWVDRAAVAQVLCSLGTTVLAVRLLDQVTDSSSTASCSQSGQSDVCKQDLSKKVFLPPLASSTWYSEVLLLLNTTSIMSSQSPRQWDRRCLLQNHINADNIWEL